MIRTLIAAFRGALLLGLAGTAQADEVVIGAQYPLSGPMAAIPAPICAKARSMKAAAARSRPIRW